MDASEVTATETVSKKTYDELRAECERLAEALREIMQLSVGDTWFRATATQALAAYRAKYPKE